MSETMTVLRQLAVAFPNTAMSKETIAVYLRHLSDIPVDVLQTVIDQCIVECTFLPTIAEIRERYRLLTADVNVPTPEEGWEEVMREIRHPGSWGTPQFNDPVVARVVKTMDWLTLCRSENPIADRRQFLDLYKGLTKRRDQLAKMTPDSLQFIADRHGETSAGDAARSLLEKLNGSAPKEIVQDE